MTTFTWGTSFIRCAMDARSRKINSTTIITVISRKNIFTPYPFLTPVQRDRVYDLIDRSRRLRRDSSLPTAARITTI